MLNIYFDRLFCETSSCAENGGTAKTFTYNSADGICTYNFVLRDISAVVPEIKENTLFDIITPFDYGGPHYDNESVLPEFFKEFSLWCADNSVVSEFIRFAPTYDFNFDIISRFMDTAKIGDHVYVSLKHKLTEQYSESRKRNVAKSEMRDVSFGTCSHEEFYSLYLRTMQRLSAHPYFHFSEVFIKQMAENFGQIFCIRDADIITHAILVLEEDDTAYYFLGASSGDDTGLNSLLFHKTAQYYQEKGKHRFFLGGGSSGVYNFKRRFSKLTLPYYIGKKVHNHKEYDKLTEMTNREQNSFFPKYRERII